MQCMCQVNVRFHSWFGEQRQVYEDILMWLWIKSRLQWHCLRFVLQDEELLTQYLLVSAA